MGGLDTRTDGANRSVEWRMRKSVRRAFLAVGIAFLASTTALSGCADTNTGSDIAATTRTYGPDEQAALDALKAACNDGNDPDTLHARAKEVLKLMREHGVEPTPTENVTFVLKWVRRSIPVELQPVPCVDEFVIYSRMRETGMMAGP